LVLKGLKAEDKQRCRRKQNENQQGREVATGAISGLAIAEDGSVTLPAFDAPG
jgi:hypothetical protein